MSWYIFTVASYSFRGMQDIGMNPSHDIGMNLRSTEKTPRASRLSKRVHNKAVMECEKEATEEAAYQAYKKITIYDKCPFCPGKERLRPWLGLKLVTVRFVFFYVCMYVCHVCMYVYRYRAKMAPLPISGLLAARAVTSGMR